MLHRREDHKMPRSVDVSLFPKGLVCLLVFHSLVAVYDAAVGKSSESESFFKFIKAFDPQNALKLDWKHSESHPCFLGFNGVKCNLQATNIVEIWLENSNLSGKLDTDSLCNLQHLRIVNLANNCIQGKLPESILYCTNLTFLNLSSNCLSGKLQFALTELRYITNVDNKVVGISDHQKDNILRRRYRILEASERISSRRLLQLRDTTHPESDESDPTLINDNGSKQWHQHLKIMIPLLGALLLVLVFTCIFCKKAKKLAGEVEEQKPSELSPMQLQVIQEVELEKPQPDLEKPEPELERPQPELVFFVEEQERFKLDDLLEATADLRSHNVCSSLYKVRLKNNITYAVKRLKNLLISGENFAEILKQIGGMSHPNILPIVAFHAIGEEKLLIYKFQSKGSLLNLLEDYIQGKRDFPWKLRLSIARGIARGLNFIHQSFDGGQIIPHGNLKLSNILLSENEEPLISEYGYSKMLDPNKAWLCTSNGYAAPEQCLTGEADVYSFGLIILELLTGKSIEISGIDLSKWVKSIIREEWTGEVFDKEVNEEGHEGAFALLNVAVKCTLQSPQDRPSMKEVFKKIEEVIHAQMDHPCCDSHNCCVLHTMIPDTWDSPGSNY